MVFKKPFWRDREDNIRHLNCFSPLLRLQKFLCKNVIIIWCSLTQGWTVQHSFPLHRRVQNPHENVSHGRAKQLQKMPYVAVPCSWIPPASLCCCSKTARDGNSDPPGVDGYTHVFHGFLLLIYFGFFKVCSTADWGEGEGVYIHFG